MKKITLIVCSFLCSLSLFSQVPKGDTPGDTLLISTVISFEEPTPYISIHQSAGNIWQIGAPHKTFFDSAYSVPNAIITDTSGSYPVNNHSWFDLYVGTFNLVSYPYNTFIDFHQKLDSDTLMDGGYIEVSWDKGQTFMNMISDTLIPYFMVNPSFQGLWGNTNTYNTTNTLYNGEYGWSGRSNGWVHSNIAWWMMPVMKGFGGFPDTMIVRFNFISDNIDHAREGWMIDQIRLYTMDVGSGTNDLADGSAHATVSPNPAAGLVTVNMDRSYAATVAELYNAIGTRVETISCENCSAFTLNRNGLPAGLYLLKLKLDNKITETKRIIIL